MAQTPASFPIHGNAAAEHWTKEARKYSDRLIVVLMASALTMFVFSVAMSMALDQAHDAANQAAGSAKEARHSAEAARCNMHSEQVPRTWPTWSIPEWADVKIMQCDAEKCEVR